MLEGLHKIVALDETIVAIATPLGHSGIGVVRMSGAAVLSIAQRFFKAPGPKAEIHHQKIMVGKWLDLAGEDIDEVVLAFFRAPHSYTGEDVLEISGHGNPLVLRRIVDTARCAGARLAMPGEFTLRAVAHGKIDLLQAEAVREFIDAQTEQQAKTALRQMEGALSKRLKPVKARLLDVIAHLEAGVDFAEDDVDVPSSDFLNDGIRPIQVEIVALRESFGYGKILSRGLRLAIVGRPNVGKSSLFNRLLSADRAIVTEIPGTTRDVLTETINVNGVPLRIADTAGIRETMDRVESAGVVRAFETLADADLVLILLDGSMAADPDDLKIIEKTSGVPRIVVINKVDLPQRIDIHLSPDVPRVAISAKTGEGLENLQTELQAFLLSQKTHLADDLVLTSERQFEALGKAEEGLGAAMAAVEGSVPHEMVLLDLYRALAGLNELTGEVVTDDILDRIFSTFCIGK